MSFLFLVIFYMALIPIQMYLVKKRHGILLPSITIFISLIILLIFHDSSVMTAMKVESTDGSISILDNVFLDILIYLAMHLIVFIIFNIPTIVYLIINKIGTSTAKNK